MLKTEAIGIIFANMHDATGGEISKFRSMASIPFGGRYRFIDFPLSCMTACGIQEIVVVTKSNYRSLMDHVGSGRPWDLSRKKQGLIIAPPFAAEGEIYHGKVEALHNAFTYVERSKATHIVLADCNWIYNLDIDALFDRHTESGADITMVCCEHELNADIAKNAVTVTLDGDRVVDMQVNPPLQENKKRLVCTNTFVANRDKLTALVKDAMSRNHYNFERDVLLENIDKLDIRCYVHSDYSALIYNIKSYYRANMDLLKESTMDSLFNSERQIRTKVRDEAPVRYGLDSHIKRSVVADGCVIDGDVENCILFRGVHIGKNAVVKNSIIMQGSIIEDGVELDYVIADKNVRICQELAIRGVESYPLYIEKGRVLD